MRVSEGAVGGVEEGDGHALMGEVPQIRKVDVEESQAGATSPNQEGGYVERWRRLAPPTLANSSPTSTTA